MGKFKTWLYGRFLPDYCREDLLSENRRLRELLSEQKAENERMRSYIRGVDDGIRAQRRIIIRNEVSK